MPLDWLFGKKKVEVEPEGNNGNSSNLKDFVVVEKSEFSSQLEVKNMYPSLPYKIIPATTPTDQAYTNEPSLTHYLFDVPFKVTTENDPRQNIDSITAQVLRASQHIAVVTRQLEHGTFDYEFSLEANILRE